MEATQHQADRLQWLKARQAGIGGSDAAALFGVNPFQSPFALWESKITETVIDEEGSPAQYWGTKLEPAIRDAYAEKTGRVVVNGVELAKHPEFPFMLANTDGLIMPNADHDSEGTYEGKTTNVFNRRDWDHGPPLYYQVQLQHYCGVLGHTWGSIAVLIMGSRDPFQWNDMEANPSFIEALQEREYDFWHRYVLPRVPPPTDGDKSTKKALAKLFPHDNGRVIILPPLAIELHEERRDIGSQLRKLEDRKEAIDNELKLAIGENSYGAILDPQGKVVAGYSFREQHRPERVQEAVSFRSLRQASAKTVAGILHDQRKAND